MKTEFCPTARQGKCIRRMLRKARNEGDVQLHLRCQALLMIAKGMTQNTIAEILKVHHNSVYNWVKSVKEKGVDGLICRPQPGPKRKLLDEDLEELKSHIRQGPEANGYETGVWTGPLVRDVILKKFGVKYHVSQVRRILSELGFSLQYPRVQLSKADKAKQRDWLENTLPEIKKSPK